MKKIILLFSFAITVLFAQEENQTQSIELPDFVITGKESITIPRIQKSHPDFIPLLSRDFFTPEYPNEEQTTIKLPELESDIVSIGNYKQKTNAIIKLSAGKETWPKGEFYYNDWNNNFSYNAHLFGLNELEYVKNAGISTAGMSLGGKYFVDQNADFLPGLEMALNGSFKYESFNFFGSSNPNLTRKINNGFAELSVNYFSNKHTGFGFSFNDRFYEQKDDNINENVFGTDAYININIMNLDLNFKGSYKNQVLSSPINSLKDKYYFKTSGLAGFKLFNIIDLKGGVFLSECEGNTFFSPIAYGSFNLNKNISFFGEFNPNTEFRTMHDFLIYNRYYQLNNFASLFTENKFNLKLATKFEYEKYFEISGGVGYLNSDNNFYFEDNITNGLFTIHKEDIEKSYAFVNFLFRRGPLGEFYGEAKIQQVESQNEKRLPYTSTMISKLNYSYNWIAGYGLKVGLTYFNEAFTDYENTEKIPAMFDVNASFYYELFNNFRITLNFENLLNNDYYYFRNYEAKPFDVLAGFEFKW